MSLLRQQEYGDRLGCEVFSAPRFNVVDSTLCIRISLGVNTLVAHLYLNYLLVCTEFCGLGQSYLLFLPGSEQFCCLNESCKLITAIIMGSFLRYIH